MIQLGLLKVLFNISDEVQLIQVTIKISFYFQKKKPLALDRWEPGTECIGKYDFPGHDSDDLPFKKGEVIVIIQASKVS